MELMNNRIKELKKVMNGVADRKWEELREKVESKDACAVAEMLFILGSVGEEDLESFYKLHIEEKKDLH